MKKIKEDDEEVEDDNNEEEEKRRRRRNGRKSLTSGHEWLMANLPHAVCWTRELGGTPGKLPQDTPWHRPSETTEIKQIQAMQKTQFAHFL